MVSEGLEAEVEVTVKEDKDSSEKLLETSTTLDMVYWVSFAGAPLHITLHEETLSEEGMELHSQRPSFKTVNPSVAESLSWTMFHRKFAARALIENA